VAPAAVPASAIRVPKPKPPTFPNKSARRPAAPGLRKGLVGWLVGKVLVLPPLPPPAPLLVFVGDGLPPLPPLKLLVGLLPPLLPPLPPPPPPSVVAKISERLAWHGRYNMRDGTVKKKCTYKKSTRPEVPIYQC